MWYKQCTSLALSVSFSHPYRRRIIIVCESIRQSRARYVLYVAIFVIFYFFFFRHEAVMWLLCGHYSLSFCFHRQCHLLAEFALCANHLTSVSKIHVPSQSQIALKCLSVFSLKTKKQKKKTTEKKSLKKKSLASVLKGYLFVLVSMNTNGHSHLHMKWMKMYLYIYANLIGMPKATTEA